VVAVEPLPRNLEFLYRNLEYNGISTVEVFPMALSDKPGVMPLYGHADTASFISGWAGASSLQHVPVPVTTLDTIAAERFGGVPLTIKLDVEGFELEVLKGAARTLGLNPKPAWLVEIFLTNSAIPGGINRRFSETFEVFWRSGYCSYDTGPKRRLVQPRDVNRWVERGSVDRGSSNYVFLAD
jgi:FkbM family methyltransferase